MKFLLFGNTNSIAVEPHERRFIMSENKVEVRDVLTWNGKKCTVETASPLHGYKVLDTYDVVITNLQRSVSKNSGNDMYVMDIYIILAYDEKEQTVIADKRRLYKAGQFQMQEVRDALTSAVAQQLAESGEEILFLTDEVLENTLKGKQAEVTADIVRGSNGQLQITLLF